MNKKIGMKTIFIIKKLGLTNNEKDKQFYYLDNVYYKKWKKDLGRFYTLNIKMKNNKNNNFEDEKVSLEYWKLVDKLSKANIL